MSNANHIQHTGAASSNPYLAIATAYGDYTKKSFEDTKLFVEKLCGVKSLDTRRLRFKPNSRRRPTRLSLRSHRRLAHCMAILPSNPTSHSAALRQR
jgi:hypothetical protein